MAVAHQLSQTSVPNRRGAALSVAIHSAALIWLVVAPPMGLGGDSTESLMVEIIEPEPPPPAAEPKPEPPKPAPAESQPSEPRRTTPRPSKPAAPAQLDRPPPSADDVAVTEVAAPAPPRAMPGPAAPSEDELLSAFARRLWAHIAQHKPTARKFRGIATVTFAVDGDGGLVSAAITESSGSDAHDRAALAALAEAAPYPPPPPAIARERLIFTIPFEFR